MAVALFRFRTVQFRRTFHWPIDWPALLYGTSWPCCGQPGWPAIVVIGTDSSGGFRWLVIVALDGIRYCWPVDLTPDGERQPDYCGLFGYWLCRSLLNRPGLTATSGRLNLVPFRLLTVVDITTVDGYCRLVLVPLLLVDIYLLWLDGYLCWQTRLYWRLVGYYGRLDYSPIVDGRPFPYGRNPGGLRTDGWTDSCVVGQLAPPVPWDRPVLA